MAEKNLSMWRYAAGRYTIAATCPQEYIPLVVKAFDVCADVRVIVNMKALFHFLLAEGLPIGVIQEIERSFDIDDDTYTSSRHPV